MLASRATAQRGLATGQAAIPSSTDAVASARLPHLILFQQFGASRGHVRPAYIARYWSEIERRPFDGLVVYPASGWLAMTGQPLILAEVRAEMAPLADINSPWKAHSFLQIETHRPRDENGRGATVQFSNDAVWKIVADNFAMLAQVAREVGLGGIMFDNEDYRNDLVASQNTAPWFGDPAGYDRSIPIDHLDAGAKARGAQMMRAMQDVFPDLNLFFLHGVHEGVPDMPFYYDGYRLMAPFCAGMVASRVETARVFDGGQEWYGIRNAADAAASRARRLSVAANAPFLSAEERRTWPRRLEVGYMTYPFDVSRGNFSNPGMLSVEQQATAVYETLRACDGYVLAYMERDDWLTPSDQTRDGARGVSAELDAAFASARQRAREDAALI